MEQNNRDSQPQLPRKNRRKILAVVTILLTFCMTILSYLVYLNIQTGNKRLSGPPLNQTVKNKFQPHEQGLTPRQFRVLLIGVDHRPSERWIGNTDSLIVAQINPDTDGLSLLSIPRDTKVSSPDYRTLKINAMASSGNGPQTTIKTVENLIGQSLDGYVLTNFKGFKNIIDTLGGITINVDRNMYYVTGDSEDGVINLKKGTQRLNGSLALQFVRFRQDQLGDITRTKRQQEVLKAIVEEFLKWENIPKLPRIIGQLHNLVETNLGVAQLLSLGNLLTRQNHLDVVVQTLPGSFYDEKGVSYWFVNPDECRKVAQQFFNEGKTTQVFSSLPLDNNRQKVLRKNTIPNTKPMLAKDN